MKWFIICLLTVGVYGRNSGPVPECNWNLNKDLPFKDPLFFYRTSRKNKGGLILPTTQKGLRFKFNDTVEVFCPGKGNYVHQLGRDEAKATCAGGTNITIDSLNRTLKDLECVKAVGGDVQKSDRACAGDRGRILSIGYDSPVGWLRIIEVCYDHAQSITLYSQHSVYGASIEGAFVGSDRTSFKTNGLPSSVLFDANYKKKSQFSRLSRILGEDKANYYINKTSFISRGHLAPDGDFFFHSWQRSTYFYANVVPQWQSINAANYGRLEISVRKAAKTLKGTLKIWTGTEGVLELNDGNNNKVKIFLAEKDNIPIPKYIWKIVCKVTKECIVFVVSNNPFDQANEVVCTDICKAANWYQDGYENVSKGVIVCCEFKDINKSFKNLPELTVNGILRLNAKR